MHWGLASADISTGEFRVKEGNNLGTLEQELLNIDASEVIAEQIDNEIVKIFNSKYIKINQQSKTSFSFLEAESILKQYYKLQSIQGLGLKESKLALRASGGLLKYLDETNPIYKVSKEKKESKVALEFPKINYSGQSLIIDAQTLKHKWFSTIWSCLNLISKHVKIYVINIIV